LKKRDGKLSGKGEKRKETDKGGKEKKNEKDAEYTKKLVICQHSKCRDRGDDDFCHLISTCLVSTWGFLCFFLFLTWVHLQDRKI